MPQKKRPTTLPDRARVTVRFDPATRVDLEEFAASEGLGMAEVVRRIVTQSRPAMRGSIAAHRQREAERVTVMFSEAALLAFGDLAAEMERARLEWLRLGVNVNQIARTLNAGDIVAVETITELANEVTTARATLDDAVELLATMANEPANLFARVSE